MRTWIFLAIAGAGAATAYLILDRAPASTSTSPTAREGSEEAAGPDHPSPGLVDPARWAPGLHRDCTLAFGTTIAGDPPFSISLEGSWQTTVVDEAGGRPIVRVELARPLASVGSTAAPSPMLDQLGRPWFLELDPSGRIEAAWFEPGVDREARDLLKTVASYLQHGPAREPIVERDEQDVTGTYRARYERPAPGQLIRIKERYLDVMTAQGAASPEELGGPRVTESSARFELDSSSWPLRVAAEENLTVEIAQMDRPMSAAVNVQADCEAGPARSDLVGAFAAAQARLRRVAPLAEPRDAAESRAALDRQEVGGATFPELVAQLRSAPDKHGEAAVQRRLRALFSLEPSEAAGAAELLAGGSLATSGKKTLIAALTSSGSAEAQAVVVDYLASARDPELRQQALGSLGLSPTPTPATLAALAKIADSPADPLDRSTALLALGNAAKRAADEEAVTSLLERLARATTPEEQTICLRALGNTGDPRALPALTAALGSPSSDVRAAAVSSLRLIEDDAVDPLLGQTLLEDADEGVRAAAAFAATFRPLAAVLPLADEVLRTDEASRVRMAVVEMLSRRRAEDPACDELLAWAQANDADQGVREAAGRALQPDTPG